MASNPDNAKWYIADVALDTRAVGERRNGARFAAAFDVPETR